MTVRTDTGTEERDVPQAQRDQQVLDDETTVQLARYGNGSKRTTTGRWTSNGR